MHSRGVDFGGSAAPPGGFECVEPPEPDLGPEQPSDARGVLPFDFKGRLVRVVMREGEPWFFGSEVAGLLGYAKPENAVAQHCKSQITTPKQGGGFAILIPERDVYRLVMRSHLPAAEEFQEWVVGTVLPSIRRTGGCIAGEAVACTASAD